MFNDIASVRSLPTSSAKKIIRSPLKQFDTYSPSEYSRVNYPQRADHWRAAIHPEIDDKYAQIKNGESIKW